MTRTQTKTLAEHIAHEVFRSESSRQEIAIEAMSCLDQLAEFLPSGSGFDAGTTIDLNRSTSDKLVFDTSYHRMDEYGAYEGWADYEVTARPSFVFGIVVGVSGDESLEDPEYIGDTFSEYLGQEIESYIDHTAHGPAIGYRIPTRSF